MTQPARTLVVMGVAGSGKTTIARALAARLGWEFVEGDDLHPPENAAKLRAGTPLEDADRWPWLRAVAGRIGEVERAGRSSVVTCSALKRSYRDLLRKGHPSVRFVHVTAGTAVLGDRLARRTGHFAPASLLDSQLATLEPLQPDEPGVVIDATQDVSAIVEGLVARLP